MNFHMFQKQWPLFAVLFLACLTEFPLVNKTCILFCLQFLRFRCIRLQQNILEILRSKFFDQFHCLISKLVMLTWRVRYEKCECIMEFLFLPYQRPLTRHFREWSFFAETFTSHHHLMKFIWFCSDAQDNFTSIKIDQSKQI